MAMKYDYPRYPLSWSVPCSSADFRPHQRGGVMPSVAEDVCPSAALATQVPGLLWSTSNAVAPPAIPDTCNNRPVVTPHHPLRNPSGEPDRRGGSSLRGELFCHRGQMAQLRLLRGSLALVVVAVVRLSHITLREAGRPGLASRRRCPTGRSVAAADLRWW